MNANILTIIQLINIVLLVTWPILFLVALIELRKMENFPDRVRLVWALIIIIIPVLGAAAFLIVTSKNKR